MKIKGISTCFYTSDVAACRMFYCQYFSAHVMFECDWYVVLAMNEAGAELCFMQPQDDSPRHNGQGVMLNVHVDDVDGEYVRLQQLGLSVANPPVSNPWGDRSFTVSDPMGNRVYIYSLCDISPEFVHQ